MLKTYLCQDTIFLVLMVRLALAPIILYLSMLAAVGWVLCFLCALCRVLVTSLHSSLNHVVLSFTGLYLLLGIVLFAMMHRVSVKIPAGSAALTIESAFKSEAALSEKMFQHVKKTLKFNK